MFLVFLTLLDCCDVSFLVTLFPEICLRSNVVCILVHANMKYYSKVFASRNDDQNLVEEGKCHKTLNGLIS